VDPPDPARLQLTEADVRRATVTPADLAALRVEAEL
jgi:hypothetical protein